MNFVQFDDSGLDGLGLLEGLATPLWLVATDGRAVWLNDAARTLLDLPADAGAGDVRTALPPDALGALAGPERRVEVCVTVRHGRTALDIDARLTMAPRVGVGVGMGGGPLVLVEGMPDTPARQEVLRLTEQLVALSYA